MRQGTKEVKPSLREMAAFWSCAHLSTLGLQEENDHHYDREGSLCWWQDKIKDPYCPFQLQDSQVSYLHSE